MRLLGAIGVALALVAGLSACEAPRPTVIVYGDSLAWESSSEIRQWAGARGYDAVLRTRFGGAPCSLFDEMRSDRALQPEVVIVSFAGNTEYLAPCVGPDLLAGYRSQMAEMERIWRGRGARLVIGRVPALPIPVAEAVLDLMDAEGVRLGMELVDGGAYVSPGGTWGWTQPCMAGERCVGHEINRVVPVGRNIVRANDKVHLCPGPGHGFDPCSTYSSGSWRYARALTSVLAGPRSGVGPRSAEAARDPDPLSRAIATVPR